nr:monocarboxylate transporter 5-like [Maniola hyperantus]
MPLSPETLGEPAACPLRALTRTPGGEPLLHDITSASAPTSNDEELSIEAKHPIGIRGWVIVFVAFIVHLIADGINSSYKTSLFPHFHIHFGESPQKIVWITTAFIPMAFFLFGPIASFLTDRYGCRRMMIFGSILAATGFFISAFVDNIETLIFTYGIVAGFGLSLCHVAAIAIVAYYFEKKCALPTGISVCGSVIGAFIFLPLINWLKKYGWQETTLILAGFLLCMAVCGFLFHEPPWIATMKEERVKKRKRGSERKRNKRLGSSTDIESSAAGSTKAKDAVTVPIVPQYSSLIDVPTYVPGGEGVSSVGGRPYGILAARLHEMSPPKTLMSPGTPLRRTMSPYNSVSSVPETNETTQLNDKPALSLTSRKKMQRYAGACWKLTVAILDFLLFLNPAFLVFVVSNFLLHMWRYIQGMCLETKSILIAVDFDMLRDQFSTLRSNGIILYILGTILLGWIGNCERVSRILVYAVCIILCGLATVITPLLATHLGLAIVSGAFHFFVSAHYSLTSVILVEQVSLENFTKAYGILMFMKGLAIIVVPGIAWMSNLKDLDLLCYPAGGFIAMSGLILTVLPLYNAARRYNDHHKPRERNQQIYQ